MTSDIFIYEYLKSFTGLTKGNKLSFIVMKYLSHELNRIYIYSFYLKNFILYVQ